MEITYWKKQLILYTKNHYGKINYERDLKYFVAEYYTLDVEYVDYFNVFSMVMSIYRQLFLNDKMDYNLENFVSAMFADALLQRGEMAVKKKMF